jgi:hypothetical protein
LHARTRVQQKSTRVSRCAAIDRHSLRDGFTAYFVLPGDRALLPPSFADRSATLAPASGRQDHTPSPSAWASFVNAPPKRPPHPAPTSRDDREAPLLWERDGESCKFDFGRGQSEIFCVSIWTTQIRLNRFTKLEFRRTRFFAPRGVRTQRHRAKLD